MVNHLRGICGERSDSGWIYFRLISCVQIGFMLLLHGSFLLCHWQMGVGCGLCEEELVKQVALWGDTESVIQPAVRSVSQWRRLFHWHRNQYCFLLLMGLSVAKRGLSIFVHTCTYYIIDTPALTLNGSKEKYYIPCTYYKSCLHMLCDPVFSW